MLVMKFCFQCGLYAQGLTHDLSKYSPVEFLEGCRYWSGKESPNNAARKELGASYAWMHHKGRNRHHFDYWTDYSMDSPLKIKGIDMPRRYIAELICDRVAASMVYNKGNYDDTFAYKYYKRGEEKLWFVSENTKKDIDFLLSMVAKKGHEAAFKYIKYKYLKGHRG